MSYAEVVPNGSPGVIAVHTEKANGFRRNDALIDHLRKNAMADHRGVRYVPAQHVGDQRHFFVGIEKVEFTATSMQVMHEVQGRSALVGPDFRNITKHSKFG